MSQKYSMSINGESVAADSYVEVRNPANTQEVVGECPVASSAQLDQAIAAAKTAFGSWRHSTDSERVEACQVISKVCEDNAEELATLLTKEQGKPLNGLGSRFEMGGAVGWAGYTSTLSLEDFAI